jgi:hypothetical protein
METLTAFVRERASWEKIAPKISERAYFLWQDAGRPDGCADEHWNEAVAATEPTKPPTDIAVVLSVIMRRRPKDREREEEMKWRFDLRSTDLRGASLRGAHLAGARLDEAHLEGVDLYKAHLERTDLRNAHLERADLRNAYLKRADVADAYFEGAELVRAHLEGASLWRAHFENATLVEAHFGDAYLAKAHFGGATLFVAHLEGADLRFADGLTKDQLARAFGDAKTRVPPGMRPASWPPEEPIL